MGHHHDRPTPATAYAQWTDDCARAGWKPCDRCHATEQVSLAAGLGRVTAQPVTARWPAPRTDCAAMDGIAITAERAARAEPPTSNAFFRLTPRSFSWIDTGDPLPPGTDTVVMREYVTIDADGDALVDPAASLASGHHVRKRGEDFDWGEPVVPQGRRLRPADLAVAAAGGNAAVTVSRQPAVVIIPTGDEIRPAGTTPRHGEIIDSNSVWLAARCAQAGARATVTDVIPDDPDLLAATLRHAAANADLVLVIAGSSRGRGDHTSAVLAQVGGLTVAGVAIRPGHPAILGYAKAPETGTVPVIGLPGYPLATAVVFERFAVPLLASIDGDTAPRLMSPGKLDRDWTSSPEVEDWVPVALAPDGTATPARHGSGSTSQLARANSWWTIPAGQGRFSAGAEIEVARWD